MERYIQIGDVVIGKGYKYVFAELPGIGGGDVRRTEVEYVNDDGSEFNDVYFNPRSFEIKGYILAGSQEELHELKQKLIHACYPKEDTDVIYFDGVKKYRAKARGDSLPEFGKRSYRSYWYVSFVVSMIIPSFYWTDYYVTNIPIVSRTDLVSTTFTLPCVFTSRVSEVEIYNENEFDILPVVKIFGGAVTETGKIEIVNETIDRSIILNNFKINPNDIIVIDCENMTAVLNGSTNLINSFNDFEDFRIIKGKNVLKGLNNNSNSSINVTLEYYRKWIGV